MATEAFRVLVIEDNPGDARLLREALAEARESAFALTWCNCLQAGLEGLRRETFDLVLLDLGLPDCVGLQTFQKVHDEAPEVPVVVLSGLDDEAVAMEAVQGGAQDYLVKGEVTGHLLVRAIRYAIERERAEQHILHLNLVLRAIRNVNQLITREHDPQRLLQAACEEMIQTAECRCAWVLLSQGQGGPQLFHSGSACSREALQQGLPAGQPLHCVTEVLAQSSALVIRGRSAACGNCRVCDAHPELSLLLLRLAHAGNVYGVLAVMVPLRLAQDPDEQALFEELACDLAYALHALEVEQQRQAVQTALHQGERKFQALFDSVSDALFIHDFRGHFLEVNTVACERLGFTRDELLSMTVADLDAPEHKAVIRDRIRELRRHGHLFFESAYVCCDGTLIPVELSSVLIRYEGRPAILTSARDITGRRRAEEAQRMAALGQLAAGVAHEFNNVLAGMSARAQVARSLHTPETTEDLIDAVLRLAARGCEIGRNLMSFARPGEPQREPLQIEDQLEEALLLTSHELGNNQIDLVRDYRARPRLVCADSSQLQQVLVNLLINACHAMPEGGQLLLETDYLPDAAGGGEVVVRIRDSGIGIAPENLPRVFEPFFTTKGRYGESPRPGAGLGLSVSRGLIQAQGGSISLQSQIGVGTVAEVRLAAYGGPRPPVGSKPPLPEPEKAPVGHGRVLLAEDEADIRQAVTLALEASGYEVTAVGSVKEALRSLVRCRPEVIVSDLMMPGGDGRQILDLTRNLLAAPAVVFITGKSEDRLIPNLLESGAAAVLPKPFDVGELVRTVHRLMPATEPVGGGE
jgi:PAS domain S-box-containing protein